MKSCVYCNGTSPIDAKFCIDCGKAFKANEGKTQRLDATVQDDTPYGGRIEYGTTRNRRIGPFISDEGEIYTARYMGLLFKEDPWRLEITRAEFMDLINRGVITYDRSKGTIYYKGKPITIY